MKKLLLSKKTVIAICAILALVIAFTSLTFLNTNRTNKDNLAVNYEEAMSYDSSNGGASLFSSTNPASNCTIHYDLESAEQHLYNTIKSNSNNTNINVTYNDFNFTFQTANISQSRLNYMLKKKYSIIADGTCSLVAITIAAKVIKEYGTLGIIYPDSYTNEDLENDIFKELYDISISLGNTYGDGTASSTISEIIRIYLSNHDWDLNVTNNYFSSNKVENVRDSLQNALLIPAVLSISNYYNGNASKPSVGGHSVAVVGAYQYRVAYKKKYNLTKKIVKYVSLYVICNGWKDSSDGQIGNNYQILVIEDDAKSMWESHVEDWS